MDCCSITKPGSGNYLVGIPGEVCVCFAWLSCRRCDRPLYDEEAGRVVPPACDAVLLL
jgi:hypothetical protein